MFTHSLHHHIRPRHRISPSTAPKYTDTSPSPLLRDVGSSNNTSTPSEVRTQARLPFPFPEGCGWPITARRRSWVGRAGRGEPGRRQRRQYSTTTMTTTVHPPPPPPPQRACLLPLPSPEGCGPTIVLDGRMWDRKEDQGGGAEGGRPSRFVTK